MSESISFRKSVVNLDDLSKVTDTSFNFFTTSSVISSVLTVDEFFSEYTRLYFEIPIEGEINSHRYLVNRSSELLDVESEVDVIQPLLDEIANLRNQLLEANTKIVELENSSNE